MLVYFFEHSGPQSLMMTCDLISKCKLTVKLSIEKAYHNQNFLCLSSEVVVKFLVFAWQARNIICT